MRNVLAFIGFAIIVGVGVKSAVEHTESAVARDRARVRLKAMLGGMQAGGNYQTVVCMWRVGAVSMGQGEFNQAADDFDDWRRQARLDSVTSYSIDDLEMVKAAGLIGPSVSRAQVTINQRHFLLRLEDDKAVEILK
jgi:hypothetical protein